jgi:L-2-hydroxyglutarate oxidase LhgO
MTDNIYDAVIIGAGVIGLAISKKLAQEGKDVLIIEEQGQIGSVTSSRNSGVIHAGVYYDKDSLKAKFCPEGNRRMYDYCVSRSIPYLNTGKFIVATSTNEIEKLEIIYDQAKNSGVIDIEKVSGKHVSGEEPLVKCVEGLYVPSSGIVDTSALMRSYLGDIEDNGGMVSYNTYLKSADLSSDLFKIIVIQNNEEIEINSHILINASGIFAEKVANNFLFLDKENIPTTYFAKGNYFETGKDFGIKHLIYPVPNDASLGLHLGLDMGMTVRFGPDVEWTDKINYDVDIDREEMFYNDIVKYIPSIDRSLLKPGYSGIRPKLKNKGEGKSDFKIDCAKEHGINNLINLFGMESPGLTSSLVIADYVSELLN